MPIIKYACIALKSSNVMLSVVEIENANVSIGSTTDTLIKYDFFISRNRNNLEVK